MSVVLLQFYWLSFILIGSVLLLAARDKLAKQPAGKALYDFLGGTSILVKLFIALATGVELFIVPVACAYSLEWPVSYLSAFYVAVLAGTVLWMLRNAPMVLMCIRSYRWPVKKTVPACLIAALALGADYAISLYTGSGLHSDVPLHLAEVQQALNTHFSFADPMVGYNGVLDFRYSANILHALQAVAAQLFNNSAAFTWFYSYAFYRFVIWLSLFSLAYVFIPKRLPRIWSYLILALLPFIYVGYFFSMAEVPNCFAVVWASLMLVGLKLMLEKSSPYMFLAAALLTAMTHAASSMVSLVFILVLAIGLRVINTLPKRQLVTFCIAVAILAVPVVANGLVPTQATGFPSGAPAGDSLHTPIKVFQVGTVVLPKPYVTGTNAVDLLALGGIVLLLGYLTLLRSRLPKSAIRKAILYVLLLAGISIYNNLYASLAGFVFLIYWTEDKRTKLLLLLATLFYGLIIYNPLVLTLANHHVPLWLLARFQDFNVLAFITPLIGLFGLYYVVVRYWRLPAMASGYGLFIIILVAVFLPAHKFPVNYHQFIDSTRDSRVLNAKDYKAIEQVRLLDPYLTGQIVFTNDPTLLTYVGAAVSGRVGMVVGIGSSQSQNLESRASCQRQLFQFLDSNDLRAAKITRVVLVPGNNDGLLFNGHDVAFKQADQPFNRAAKLDYLSFVRQVGLRRIYAVKPAAAKTPAHTVCRIPYGQ